MLSLTPFLLLDTSDQPTDDQLEVAVEANIGIDSRFVADDSLSILEMHSVGLEPNSIVHEINSNPVISSLQNKCTVLGVEF